LILWYYPIKDDIIFIIKIEEGIFRACNVYYTIKGDIQINRVIKISSDVKEVIEAIRQEIISEQDNLLFDHSDIQRSLEAFKAAFFYNSPRVCECKELTHTLTIDTTFEAAHRLKDYEGACCYIHGHSYGIEVIIGSNELKHGMVLDFKRLKSAVEDVCDQYDHSIMLQESDSMISVLVNEQQNVVVFDTIPTAENMSKRLYNEIREKLHQSLQLVSVTVRETEHSKATYWG